MNDIFISYARDDRPRVRPLAEALQRHGWSVWWDFDLHAGEDFDRTIASELQNARCVIVVWSRRSVDSPWVKDEAEVGRQRGVLVPVRIDAVERPLGFGRVQTADLVDWDGVSRHPDVERLVADIARILERDSASRAGAHGNASSPAEKLTHKIVAEGEGSTEPPIADSVLLEAASPRPAVPTQADSTDSMPPRRARAAILRQYAVFLAAGCVVVVVTAAYVLHRRSSVPSPLDVAANPTGAIAVRTPEAPVTWPTADDRVAQKLDRCVALQKVHQAALEAHPNDPEILAAQADCAMLQLDYIRVSGENARFSDVVDTLVPVLQQVSESAAPGARSADIVAHLGWANFLKSRDGIGGLQPDGYYRRAIEQDADNPYANAMWGHWILWRRGSLAEAQAHFSHALSSGRERDFVRYLQLAALTLFPEESLEFEAIRVANEMRGNQEPPPTNDPARRVWSKFWDIYYGQLLNTDGNQRATFLAILPAAEHLATFRWLFPESQMPSDKANLWLLFLATFQEQSGDRIAARSNYQALRAELAHQHASGPLLTQTESALRRLAGP